MQIVIWDADDALSFEELSAIALKATFGTELNFEVTE